MVDSILDNHSMRTQRRGELRLEVDLSTPSANLEQLIEGIRKIAGHQEIENSNVLLLDISSSAFVILLEYFTAPVSQAAWRDKPSFMVVATKDQIIPPEMQRDQVKSAKAEMVEVSSGHVAMLSHPKEVAKLIVEAAR